MSCALLAAIALPAHADAPSTPEGIVAATPREQALRLYKQAGKMFEDEDFIAAAVTFGQAQAIFARVDRGPDGAIIDKEAHAFRSAAMSNRATAYARAQLFVEALDAFIELRATFAAELAPREMEEVTDAIARMTDHVGTIALDKLPAEELEVRFDGRLERRDLTRPLRMSEGPHVLDIKAVGYKPYAERLAVVGKQELAVKAALVPLQTPAKLRIESTVGRSQVAVDGAARGEAPVEISVAPGHHAVIVTSESYVAHAAEVDVRPGERAILEIAMLRARAPLGLRVSPSFISKFPLRTDTPFGSHGYAVGLQLFHDAVRIDNLRFGIDVEYRAGKLNSAQAGIVATWCPDRFTRGRLAWCPGSLIVDYAFGDRDGAFVSGEAAGRFTTALELRGRAGFARLALGAAVEDYSHEFATTSGTASSILVLWSAVAELAVGLDL